MSKETVNLDGAPRHPLTDTLEALVGLVPEWMAAALCAQVDHDAWFPEMGGSTTAVKKVCADCPVRAQCLQYALDNDERWGVWGGLSERERRRLKQEQGTAA